MDKKTESRIRGIQKLVSDSLAGLDTAVIKAGFPKNAMLTVEEAKELKAFRALIARIAKAAWKVDGINAPGSGIMRGLQSTEKHLLLFQKK